MGNLEHTVREKALAAALELAGGGSGLVSHFAAKQNSAAIAPLNSIAFPADAFKFRGTAALIIAGIAVETQGTDQAVLYSLQKDGVAMVASQGDVSADKFGFGTLAWIDQGNTPGSSHTYQITATNATGGQTVQVANSAGQAWILILELA
jgi:hypothetical protein